MPKAWQIYATTSWFKAASFNIFYNHYNPSGLKNPTLDLDNKEIRFPVEANKKLKSATENQRKNIEIIWGGTGLHLPDLDEDLSVTGIIEGRYGY